MAGKHGFGAKFQLSATAIVGTAGDLADLTSVPQPILGNAAEETTNHGSAGGVQEFIPSGVITVGEMELGMNLVPGAATDTACTTAVMSRTLQFFKITVPAATGSKTYSGQCVVTEYAPGEATIDGKMEATLTIQPSGPITTALVA